jgi:hypothetical protein
MLITGTSRRLSINKTVKTLIQLPDDKREKLIHVYQSVISTWRKWFWMAPLYILVVPVFLFVIPTYLPARVHSSVRQLFLADTTGSIVIYIYMLEDFSYKKKLLKAIDKPTERETL